MNKMIVIAFIAVLLSSCEKDTLNRSNQKDDSVITLAQVRNTWIHESKYSDDIKEYDSLQAKTLPFVELDRKSTRLNSSHT